MAIYHEEPSVHRFFRRTLVLIGLAALLLASGLDTADAAAVGPAGSPDAADMASWIAIAFLAIVLTSVLRAAAVRPPRRAAVRRKSVPRIRRG